MAASAVVAPAIDAREPLHVVPLSFLAPVEEAEEGKRLSNVGIAFTLFKANIGVAVLYMPRAWRNGGYAFSTIVLPFFGVIAVGCSLKLIKCRLLGCQGTYGDLMAQAVGPWGRTAVEISVVMLQFGLCCAYFISVSQLLQDTLFHELHINALIAILVLVWGPMICIRRVSRLWMFSIAGSVLVIGGAFATLYLEGGKLISVKPKISDLSAVNWDTCLIFIGTGCFAFEGIALTIPTFDSARQPQYFTTIFISVMLFIGALIMSMGLVGYVACGEGVSTLVLLDLQEGALATSVQLAFAAAIIFTFPLQMAPALQINEGKLFETVINPPLPRKCKKNAFRVALVVVLAFIAVIGATDLDNFVSLIGAVCGVPLAFIYPALCHLRLVLKPEDGFPSRLLDMSLVFFGTILTVAVTVSNIRSWGVNT